MHRVEDATYYCTDGEEASYKENERERKRERESTAHEFGRGFDCEEAQARGSLPRNDRKLS